MTQSCSRHLVSGSLTPFIRAISTSSRRTSASSFLSLSASNVDDLPWLLPRSRQMSSPKFPYREGPVHSSAICKRTFLTFGHWVRCWGAWPLSATIKREILRPDLAVMRPDLAAKSPLLALSGLRAPLGPFSGSRGSIAERHTDYEEATVKPHLVTARRSLGVPHVNR